jgi:magnesium chelatase subunit I
MAVENTLASGRQDQPKIKILPYSRMVGQQQIKLALEIAFISPPRLGGVLISGQRGTGKSTAVRAFSQMVYDQLPVTLPINATEDRVVGGWNIEALLKGDDDWQSGLLTAANGKLLYVDEVNLLDDHIVNIILDVTSTGVLVVQREGRDQNPEKISFTLVGTMNPEEGGLRPQLLDRFGLMVSVQAESGIAQRVEILNNVLRFDEALADDQSKWWKDSQTKNQAQMKQLQAAKQKFSQVEIADEMIELCIKVAEKFKAQGNRGDYVLVMAAKAYAALQGGKDLLVDNNCLRAVAPLALQHRRPESGQGGWTDEDNQVLDELLSSE